MKTYARPLILALAAVALVASVLSLYVHYQLIHDPAYTSFCDVTETVSCEAVLQSQYATMFGIPVAAGGAIWSALVLLLAWRGMGSRSRETSAAVAGYIFLLATVGLSAVLYLGYASFFVLQKACPLCLTMYVSVIGIFIVSGAAASVSLASLPGRISRDISSMFASPVAATLAAVWLIGSASLVAFFPREEVRPATEALVAPAPPTETLQGEELSQFAAWLDAQPRAELAVPKGGAQVLVVKFNDFQCPACRQAYLEYKWVVDKYRKSAPDKVKFVNVDFPLEAECGVANLHPSACEAAAAVRMARAKNRGDEMEEWLFTNQSTLTPDAVKKAVREVGQVTDFDAQYPKVLEQVRADSKMGQTIGIQGTPTFYINGIKINATLRPIYFDAAIAHELEKASGIKPQASAGP
jgi:uncharacterized membrane protein/predicted DsbA family dithiol-disulfide isomerase